jgi:hypothetical protein
LAVVPHWMRRKWLGLILRPPLRLRGAICEKVVPPICYDLPSVEFA